ncbi:hypothetical protein B0H16DRAFT_1256247, partial [Mycena metata]
PGFPSVTVEAIQADFHAPDFIHNLGRFLQTKGITPRLQPALNTTFPLYKRLFLTLAQIPEVGSASVRDTVRAVRGERSRITAKGIIPAKPGTFDTVLVRVQPREVNDAPTHGLCVARVRAIFRIPDDFGQYPDPVVYVDWFKPLNQPLVGLGMYQVSLSTRNNRQNSSIIPVTDIARS